MKLRWQKGTNWNKFTTRPPEETVSNDDVDMTGESLAADKRASFRKLKNFPVVSNELTYSTSTPHMKSSH